MQGFTLLEVLIAISIFALMSLASFQILQGVIRSGEISKRHNDELLQLQRAMLVIEQDFTQIIARASRDEANDGDTIRVLTAAESLFESSSAGLLLVSSARSGIICNCWGYKRSLLLASTLKLLTHCSN